MIRSTPRQRRRTAAPVRARHGPAGLRRSAVGMAVVAGLALAAGAFPAGCASQAPEQPTEARFPNIQDRSFKLKNPSRMHASATGIGCGGTELEALTEARRTAHYNLRGVTGNQSYRVEYLLLREVPREGLHCVEVEARAVP